MRQEKNGSMPVPHQLGDFLIEEAISGNLPSVRELIACGADINFANINGVTPLMAAAQWKQMSVLTFLLTRGAGTNAVEESTGRTSLMYACLSGSAQCVKLLVQAGAEVNVRDCHGMTALMMAAVTGETDMVRCLVKAGADTDCRDENQFTAVDWAAKWGRRNVVNYLVSTDGRIRGSR
jgi:uncharacterized protein